MSAQPANPARTAPARPARRADTAALPPPLHRGGISTLITNTPSAQPAGGGGATSSRTPASAAVSPARTSAVTAGEAGAGPGAGALVSREMVTGRRLDRPRPEGRVAAARWRARNCEKRRAECVARR